MDMHLGEALISHCHLEETGALAEVCSVQCYSSLFPTLAHIENGAVLLAFWDEKPGSSALCRAGGLSLTHLFCTQVRRLLRGCKIEPLRAAHSRS